MLSTNISYICSILIVCKKTSALSQMLQPNLFTIPPSKIFFIKIFKEYCRSHLWGIAGVVHIAFVWYAYEHFLVAEATASTETSSDGRVTNSLDKKFHGYHCVRQRVLFVYCLREKKKKHLKTSRLILYCLIVLVWFILAKTLVENSMYLLLLTLKILLIKEYRFFSLFILL